VRHFCYSVHTNTDFSKSKRHVRLVVSLIETLTKDFFQPQTQRCVTEEKAVGVVKACPQG